MTQSKAELGKQLTDRAKELDRALEQDPLEIGAIAYQMQTDRELFFELGFSTLEEWGQKVFGKKWSSVKKWAKVYATLFVQCEYTKTAILQIGTVKANQLARLPESEIRKQEWQDAAKELNTADFKRKVKDHMEEHGSDHREGFCKVSFDAPKSFRDETWKRVLNAGMLHEGIEQGGDVYLVVEAALASYEQELNATDTEATGKDAAAPEGR